MAHLYMLEQQKKQDFLLQEIVNKGYDQIEFANYLSTRREDGLNIDNWEFDELMMTVQEFQSHYSEDQFRQQFHEETVGQERRQTLAQMVNQKNDQPQQPKMQEETKEDIDLQMSRMKVQRSSIKTKKVNDVPTPLNFKKITIKVSEGMVKDSSMISFGYLQYKIQTEPLGYEVRRKDTDFVFLRKILQKQFPHMIIPPCTSKPPKNTKKHITKRERYYTRFLNSVVRSEELKTSQFLLDFLYEKDQKAFTNIQKEVDKAKYGKTIEELITFKGAASLQSNTTSTQFCVKFSTFADEYQSLYKQIMDSAREINTKSADLASSIYGLHKFLGQMSELNQNIKCQSQSELFKQLSMAVHASGHQIAQQGELVENYLGEYFKFNLDEHESYRELFNIREQLNQQYVKIHRALIDKKEKLFKSKDLMKWGCFKDQEEMNKLKDDLLKDKFNKAFAMMLPKETLECDQKREELLFYTNQCWDEIKRVSEDNGRLLREHFKEMSQSQCSYLNQNHQTWADFLSHFADLCQQDVEQINALYQEMQAANQLAGGDNGQLLNRNSGGIN